MLYLAQKVAANFNLLILINQHFNLILANLSPFESNGGVVYGRDISIRL